MTIYKVPPGALLLDGPALAVVAYSVAVAQQARRRNGRPPLAALDALASTLAAAGQADEDQDHHGDAEYMTTDDAARLLGISPRTARRLAPGLGGRKVGGRWLVDALAVREHLDGRNQP